MCLCIVLLLAAYLRKICENANNSFNSHFVTTSPNSNSSDNLNSSQYVLLLVQFEDPRSVDCDLHWDYKFALQIELLALSLKKHFFRRVYHLTSFYKHSENSQQKHRTISLTAKWHSFTKEV